MRRGFGIGAAILALLLAIGIGVGAYNWGLNEGLERVGAVEVVRYVDGPGGFFPFGLILFPLFLFGIFALIRSAFWRGRWGGHHHNGPGAWGKDAPPMFEEWHRRQHERGGGGPEPAGSGAGGAPASA